MKKKTFIYFLGILLLCCLTNCTRDLIDSPSNQEVQFEKEARKHFETTATSLQPASFAEVKNISRNSAIPESDEVLTPHWDEGCNYLRNGIRTYEIPLDKFPVLNIKYHTPANKDHGIVQNTASRRTLVIQRHEETQIYRYFIVTKIADNKHMASVAFKPEYYTFMKQAPFSGIEIISDVTGKILAAYHYQNDIRQLVHLEKGTKTDARDSSVYFIQQSSISRSLSRGIEGGILPGGDADVIWCKACNHNKEDCICCSICHHYPCTCYTPPVFYCPYCGSAYCSGNCRCPLCGKVGCNGSCQTPQPPIQPDCPGIKCEHCQKIIPSTVPSTRSAAQNTCPSCTCWEEINNNYPYGGEARARQQIMFLKVRGGRAFAEDMEKVLDLLKSNGGTVGEAMKIYELIENAYLSLKGQYMLAIYGSFAEYAKPLAEMALINTGSQMIFKGISDLIRLRTNFILKDIARSATGNLYKPLGRGCTAGPATESKLPSTLAEDLSIMEVQANPKIGTALAEELGDPRWPAKLGWKKYKYHHKLGDDTYIKVHYVAQEGKDGVIIAIDDLKIKLQ